MLLNLTSFNLNVVKSHLLGVEQPRGYMFPDKFVLFDESRCLLLVLHLFQGLDCLQVFEDLLQVFFIFVHLLSLCQAMDGVPKHQGCCCKQESSCRFLNGWTHVSDILKSLVEVK